jgi:hypothetical protein
MRPLIYKRKKLAAIPAMKDGLARKNLEKPLVEFEIP